MASQHAESMYQSFHLVEQHIHPLYFHGILSFAKQNECNNPEKYQAMDFLLLRYFLLFC
ncbi:hypothetical protein BGLA2_990016 [Burkholderia gladioli]|nr:hypothetical protein BGLA2_990016 [Burkholderia gladioli]